MHTKKLGYESVEDDVKKESFNNINLVTYSLELLILEFGDKLELIG